MSTPTEDERKRSDRDGRFYYRCAVCNRWFLARPGFGSMAGPRVTVCGVVLSPPQPHCLLTDDLGNWWWPEDEPLPDLIEIDEFNRAEMAEGDARLGSQ